MSSWSAGDRGNWWARRPMLFTCGSWLPKNGGPPAWPLWGPGALGAAWPAVRAVDARPARFSRYFFGQAACQPAQYDLVANTARLPLDMVVATVAEVARAGGTRENIGEVAGAPGGRVLTLSRELGAGDTGFAPTLGDRLGLRVY